MNEESVPYTADRLLMALEHLNVVHIGLPVLDVARVIRRHHPLLVVGPHHRPNRRIVRLQKQN